MFSCIRGEELTFKNLVNGEWITSNSNKYIDIYSPVGNCLVGKVPSMTKEEVDAEKRKLLYHWIGLLSSLTKLRNAGELDVESTLAQLTEPMMIERVNALLSENPNLLETDKYILLHSLLGRDLYMEGRLIPIRATEINMVAKNNGGLKNGRTNDF